MTATVKCCSRVGDLLDVLDNAQLGTRSWVSNRIGDFDFRLPRTDPKATKTNLGRMNLIQVDSDTGVKPWGGRIKEVIWEDPAYIYVKCESKEALLRRQNVYLSCNSASMTPGSLLWQFIPYQSSRAAFPGDIHSISGSIDSGGETGDWSIHDIDLWDGLIQQILQFVTDRRLKPYIWVEADGVFYFQYSRGVDRSATVILRSGYHIQKWPRYRLDYTQIITQAVGSTNHAQWGYKLRMPVRNIPAYNEWGALETAVQTVSCTSAACAKKHAKMHIRENYAALEMLDIQINNRDGIWGKFWIGDVVRVVIPNFGWEEEGGCDVKLKIQGIEIQEKVEKMRIIGSVVLPTVDDSWGTY